MILFKDPKIAEKARVLRDHGMSKDEVIGYNYRLTNIQAAIGVAQMEKFQDILNNKIKISSSYDSYFKEVEGIMKLPNKLQYSYTQLVWAYSGRRD